MTSQSLYSLKDVDILSECLPKVTILKLGKTKLELSARVTSRLRQDSYEQTGMVDDFKISGIPKTLVKRKTRLHSLYFPQNTLVLTESRGEFHDLHSIFRLRALRYWHYSSYSK